jgi:polyhydroxybutyrate depolymerase
MAHGFACRNAEAVAGIATLAGATYQDPADCQPARDVPVLAIHGTADASIEYEGGEILGVPFPGALETVALRAADGGCSDLTTSEPPFDGHLELPGADTEVLRYDLGCGAGGAELWTIVEGEHIPPLTDELRARLRDWLAAAAQHLFSDGFETGTDAAWGP